MKLFKFIIIILPNNTNQTSINDILKSVYDAYKSPMTTKINIHSLIETLVSDFNNYFLLHIILLL